MMQSSRTYRKRIFPGRMTRGLTTEQRLVLYSTPEPNTGCLLWFGKATRKGYGQLAVKVGGKVRTAQVHRLAYETWIGPIPDGHDIDHKCRVRCCIEPTHLRAMTPADNRGRPRVNKVTDEMVVVIRAMRAGGRRLKEIAFRFNLGLSTVCAIARGNRKRHVA